MKASMGATVNRRPLNVITQELSSGASRLVTTTAFQVEAEAKVRAPVAKVNGGTLRRDIHVEDVDDYHKTVGNRVHYAPYQEFGTVKMAAHPYLTPAMDVVQPRFEAGLAELFR